MATDVRPRRLISPQVRALVQTRADIASLVSGTLGPLAEAPTEQSQELEDSRDEWEHVVDHQLIEWGRDSSCFDDDEFTPPSGRTIMRAIEVAKTFGSHGLPSPTRVVADPHGGVVFERRSGKTFETIRVNADGSIEHCGFYDSKLIVRESW